MDEGVCGRPLDALLSEQSGRRRQAWMFAEGGGARWEGGHFIACRMRVRTLTAFLARGGQMYAWLLSRGITPPWLALPFFHFYAFVARYAAVLTPLGRLALYPSYQH